MLSGCVQAMRSAGSVRRQCEIEAVCDSAEHRQSVCRQCEAQAECDCAKHRQGVCRHCKAQADMRMHARGTGCVSVP